MAEVPAQSVFVADVAQEQKHLRRAVEVRGVVECRGRSSSHLPHIGMPQYSTHSPMRFASSCNKDMRYLELVVRLECEGVESSSSREGDNARRVQNVGGPAEKDSRVK